MIGHLYTMIIVITYLFFTEIQFVYVTIYSTCPRYILQGYPLGTHLLILNLNALKDADTFISLSTKSHVFELR